MSDGFGENHCDFSYWRQKPGTAGKEHGDFERVTGSAPEGTPVFFVNSIVDYDEDESNG